MIIRSVMRTWRNDGFYAVMHKSANRLLRGGEDVIDYDSFNYAKREAPCAVLEGISENDPVLVNAEHPLLAIQAHVYFTELLDEIIETVNVMPYPFDLFVSTDTEKKKAYIENHVATCKAHKIVVETFDNQGRDIAPFLQQLSTRIDSYKYICHLHTKKSETVDFGDNWRQYLYKNLFGSPEYLRAIFSRFQNDSKLGIVTPEIYPLVRCWSGWNGARHAVEKLLVSMNLKCELPATPFFPAGSMFWARTDAISPLFKLGLTSKDFPDEAGQVDYTLAHVIERIWIYLAQARGYSYALLQNEIPEVIEPPKVRRLTLFVHYDKSNTLSSQDQFLLSEIKRFSEKLIVITHSKLIGDSAKILDSIADSIIVRENEGLDFAAWQYAMQRIGFDEITTYDELLLANNSCIGPVRSFDSMFAHMAEKNVDFWGITIFPKKEVVKMEKATLVESVRMHIDGDAAKKFQADRDLLDKLDSTPEHIQSYFMNFNQKVISSDAFREFWKSYESSDSYTQTVVHGETTLTKHLSDAGFSYSAVAPESKDAIDCWGTEQPQYHCLFEYLLLDIPLLKKKGATEMRTDRKKALVRYLRQINAPQTCIEYFE